MRRDDNFGYDETFLGTALPQPRPLDDRAVRGLTDTHFTVLLDPLRRLAVSTAVNIDGSSLRDLDRGDDWHFDSRVSESEQTGPDVYARNLDRLSVFTAPVLAADDVWRRGGAASRSVAAAKMVAARAPSPGRHRPSVA